MSGGEDKSSDSDTKYYSADEDLVEGKPLTNTTSSRKSRSKEASPEVKAKLYSVSQPEVTITIQEGPPETKPIPPPRRKRKGTLVKQASAEETKTQNSNELDLTNDEVRRANTFSWPRGEKPIVQDYPTNSDLPSQQTDARSHRTSNPRPSISIEDTQLEFTEDMMDEPQSRVESNDGLLLKAVDTKEKIKSIVVYNSDDEESIDGELDGPEGEGEGEKSESKEEPPTVKTQLSDSQILEETLIKNLDTGEKFPLSLAEKKIPLPKIHDPIISLCEERATELSENWDVNEDNDGDSEGPTNKRTKPKKKRFKKFFAKEKKKGESRPLSSGSDDEISPEHDSRTVKYKAASHNKGSLDFEKVRLKQELRHSTERSKAIWVMEFSVCGRLLATAGQDSVVRVWVLRSAYPFFHELQQKYARIGVHSSADSLSEKSSVHSSETEDFTTGTTPFLETPLCSYTGHGADVLDLSWSKNFFLLSSSMDKTVRLWHISRSECLCCFQHIDFVTAIAFHPRDDRYFLSGSLDGKLRLWNIPDKKVALWNELEGVGSHLITAANFCMNGKLAVAGTYDGRCIFYETEHLKYHTQIHVRSRHGKNRGRKISGIEPLPGEDKILVTSNDSRIRLYNLKDHSLTCKYKGCLNTSSQIRASFSRDGHYIVCGSEDCSIYVWKTHHDHSKLSSTRRDRNDCYECFTTHSAVVTAVTFAPVPGMTVDKGLQEIGEVIVAGDYHGHIRVYVNSDDL